MVSFASREVTPMRGYLFVQCSVCVNCCMLFLKRKQDAHVFGNAENHSAITLWEQYTLLKVHPEYDAVAKVSSLPPNVLRSFEEAEKAYGAGLFSSAGGMYRKTIERALKAEWPDLSGRLATKIKKLGKDKVLPSQLIDLLNVIRFLGNDSMHEDDDPTKEEVAAAKEFTNLFLTYTFQMPSKVATALKKYETPPEDS